MYYSFLDYILKCFIDSTNPQTKNLNFYELIDLRLNQFLHLNIKIKALRITTLLKDKFLIS